ncbi:alpha/beta hydrolase [Nocardia sp. alder85J]|uniref:alpha/beta hydrolase n=1 Tax=Nocardia sp. alder85J TaxID=2862949 RepID=UPI001CD2D0D6|nr:alpha/beta hydrolase [Nocardia sp. alder85J]MCX4095835.1 alpha/beta hydrolase [Nocardia sp. alder85J]
MARTELLAQVEKMYIDGFPDATDASIEDLRASYDALLTQFPLPDDAEVTTGELGGVPVVTVTAAGASTSRVLVWFHGGGYVLGSAAAFSEMGHGLSRASGLTVILPDYRRAPEHKFPAAVDDAVVLTRAVLAQYGAGKVAFGGDSAGGGLTVATLVSLRDAGVALPAAAVLISPLLDFSRSGDTIATNADTDIAVSDASIRDLGAAYLQGHDERDPLASPLFAELTGLPPVLAMVGSAEVLLDDSRRFAEAVRATGGTASVSVYDDMCHVWTLFASILPEGAQALGEAGAFLKQHVAG